MKIGFALPLVVACGTDPANATQRAGDAGRTDAAAQVSGAARTYAPTFSAIYGEVFVEARCTLGLCHGEGASGGGLDLYPRADAYGNLVGVSATSAGCSEAGFVRVEPGAPEQSLLVLKLSDEPPCGVTMPPDRLVDAEQLDQVAEWIRRGAPDD